jgi:EAL domain-containing protein (putative c-di-GMP-specific phosphodiesterase class I)
LPTAVRSDTIKAERDRYVALAFTWADLLFELDRHFTVLFAAGATRAFFGRSSDALVGTPFRDLVAPPDVPKVGETLKKILNTGRIQEEFIRVLGPDKSWLYVALSAYCLGGNDDNLFVALRKSSAIAARAALAEAAVHGGLFDSGSFADVAAHRIKTLQDRGEEARVTVVSLPAIDEIQTRIDVQQQNNLDRAVGEYLQSHSVGGDTAAKLSNGLFSLLRNSETPIAEIVGQLEEITKRMDPTGQGSSVEAATVPITEAATFSEQDLVKGLGYMMTKFSDSVSTGVGLGDLASSMSTLINEAANKVTEFKQIIALSEFYVALQPIIHIYTGEIHHYEALCRFDAKPGESPFKYITFAEETGLIHEFDLAMAQKVIAWLSKHQRSSDKYRVAVNVSGFSISQPAYLDSLTRLLDDNAWTKGKLMFEITESSRMSDLDSANSFIQALRQKGYHICLDDFGAGAASFQYLSVLDVDVVKLDGSAIKNAQRAPKGRAFLTALTELCRRMTVETVAEMVDTVEALDFCRDCGCNYVQGYLFGKPSREVKDFTPLPQSQLFRKSSAFKS